MKLAMLTASCDNNLQEEGFIPDWINSLAQQVDQLVVITLKKPKTTVTSNVKIYYLSETTKIGKLLQLNKILSSEHHHQKFDGIFNHIFDFLAVAGAVWGKTHGVKTAYWYAGGIPFSLFSLTALALNLNDHVLTCSENEKRKYCQNARINPAKVKVLGHGISTDHFKPLDRKPNDKFTIGYVCRATPNKNVETLIRAIAKVSTKKSIHLKLALARLKENSEYTHLINQELKKLNPQHISYEILTNLNYDHLPQFYNSLDLYVHPSKLTSIDKAGLEAAFCGIPVLLSKTSYSFLKDSSTLFDPNNGLDLSHMIENIINSDLSKKVITDKFSSYSLDSFCKNVIAIY